MFYIVVNPRSSKFARTLQAALRTKVRDRVLRTTRVQRPHHTYFHVTPQVLNKIQQFKAFNAHNVSCPASTTDRLQLASLGTKTVFARTLVNSTGGAGIVEFNRLTDPTPYAPLYTAYIKKKAEFRVHVFAEKVIDVQQKKKRRGFEGTRDTRIRNLLNGYVYTRDGLVPDPVCNRLAIDAVRAVGYLYGAVDIIYNENADEYYVLEVNSRPGLMGTTLDKYTDALINHFNLRRI